MIEVGMINSDILHVTEQTLPSQLTGTMLFTEQPGGTVIVRVNQTVAGQSMLLRAQGPDSRVLIVRNIGNQSLTINGAVLLASDHLVFYWNGTAWRPFHFAALFGQNVITNAKGTFGVTIETGNVNGYVVQGISATLSFTEGRKYLFTWDGSIRITSNGSVGGLHLVLDGTSNISTKTQVVTSAGVHTPISGSIIHSTIPPGVHTLSFKRATDQTITDYNDPFTLNILELP